LINDINAITPTWEVLGFVDDMWIDYHCPELNKSEKGAEAVIDGYSIFGLEYFKNSNNILSLTEELNRTYPGVSIKFLNKQALI